MNQQDVTKTIIWEKWADPYGENLEELEWPGCFSATDYPISNILTQQSFKDFVNGELENDDLDGAYNDTPIDDLGEQPQHKHGPPAFLKRPIKLVMTQMGVIPMTEYSTPGKIFNFWTGHTNFSITPEIYKIIEETDGVETLDIFTRYRIKVGVGKAFHGGSVLRNINSNISKIVNAKTTTMRPTIKPFNIKDKKPQQ
jgi:hypothetical protein